MEFKPEDLNFHREAYQGILAAMRPKDYPPLMKKDVSGRMDLRHRRPNPYTRNGKALVSFVAAGKNPRGRPQGRRPSGRSVLIFEGSGPHPPQAQLQQRRPASRLDGAGFPDGGHRRSARTRLHADHGWGERRASLGAHGKSFQKDRVGRKNGRTKSPPPRF